MHRRDTNQIIQEMRKHKPAGHIRRFSKAMCKILGVSPRHPDIDILPVFKLLRNEPVEPIVHKVNEKGKINLNAPDQKLISEKQSDVQTLESRT